jgi:hypothetical protein
MQPADELLAVGEIYKEAVRAKALEPLIVTKFINPEECMVDAGGSIRNAAALVAGLKAKRPELFEEPPVMARPKPPKEDLTKNAFEMTKEEFDNVWAGRFPWTK